MLHIVISGNRICSNHSLIDHLSQNHVVTLSKMPLNKAIQEESVLDKADVLFIEHSNIEGDVHTCLKGVQFMYPQVTIILLNGKLTQDQIAEAFRAGAADYFPEPHHLELLMERVQYLEKCKMKKGEKVTIYKEKEGL